MLRRHNSNKLCRFISLTLFEKYDIINIEKEIKVGNKIGKKN
jgi:hypothetical protein